MAAEPSAIPPNPKTAATRAMIRKITISRIIMSSMLVRCNEITLPHFYTQKIINNLTKHLLRCPKDPDQLIKFC